MNFNRDILLFAALIGIVKCLDCHQCASKDGGCRDPYDSTDLDNSGECGPMDTHCFKQKTVLRLFDSGAILGRSRETVTETRGCTMWHTRDNGCTYKEVDAGFMFYCLCSEDNCNSGEITAISKTLLLVTAVLSFIVTKLCS